MDASRVMASTPTTSAHTEPQRRGISPPRSSPRARSRWETHLKVRLLQLLVALVREGHSVTVVGLLAREGALAGHCASTQTQPRSRQRDAHNRADLTNPLTCSRWITPCAMRDQSHLEGVPPHAMPLPLRPRRETLGGGRGLTLNVKAGGGSGGGGVARDSHTTE